MFSFSKILLFCQIFSPPFNDSFLFCFCFFFIYLHVYLLFLIFFAVFPSFVHFQFFCVFFLLSRGFRHRSDEDTRQMPIATSRPSSIHLLSCDQSFLLKLQSQFPFFPTSLAIPSQPLIFFCK